jgi:hypothetical protein
MEVTRAVETDGGFITRVYTRLLALLVVGAFAVNGVIVAPLLVYGSPYWPSNWLLMARALDVLFAVMAVRTVWSCADRS